MSGLLQHKRQIIFAGWLAIIHLVDNFLTKGLLHCVKARAATNGAQEKAPPQQ
jgi:hypothetical protein